MGSEGSKTPPETSPGDVLISTLASVDLLTARDEASPSVPATRRSGAPLGSPPEAWAGAEGPLPHPTAFCLCLEGRPALVSWTERVLTRVTAARARLPSAPALRGHLQRALLTCSHSSPQRSPPTASLTGNSRSFIFKSKGKGINNDCAC